MAGVPTVAIKSTDCGPTSPSSVTIEDVTGEGVNAETAIKNAHATAKTLGQASCQGGGCPAAKLCKYVEDNWEATAVLKDYKWVASGTTSGHCACE